MQQLERSPFCPLVQVGIEFPPGRVQGIQIGASVAINGTCLTVTEIQGDSLSFDIMVCCHELQS